MNNPFIIDICKYYDVHPEKIEFIRNNERVLVKIEDDHTYFLKGEEADQDYWEACCTYAEYLSLKGMRVAQYIKSIEGSFIRKFGNKVYSLEHFLPGEALGIVTDKELEEMGRLLGRQHQISMQIASPFTSATSWSLFGGNETDAIGDYDENELSFLELEGTYQFHPLFSEIQSLYKEYRENLQQVWPLLPQGAVQGDFCFYNMIKGTDGSLGIFDFNLAGNEVYLNECIGAAVYHAWHVPYEGKLNEDERYELFIGSYRKERDWNTLECAAASPLKANIKAFRYNRIEEGILLKGTPEQISFLQETLDILVDVKICN